MIRIIPAIDLIGGKCVRLSQGDYARGKIYNENPLDVARMFEDCGISMLHLVDLDGARSGSPANLGILETIAARTSLKVEFGGGLKDEASLESAFDAGACRAICGSVACSAPELFGAWLHRYGSDRLVLGADARDGMVAVNGWKDNTSVKLEDLLHTFLPEGLRTAIVTDISRDGMLSGPSVELYIQLMSRFPELEIVASGGVGNLKDLEALDNAGVASVIVGKALYEGRISMKELAAVQEGSLIR